MTNFLFFKRQHIKPLGFFILMFMVCTGMNAQSTITGSVSASDGPIPGANVILKGTNTGAATNFDGEFVLNNVPANGVLVFSFLGYKTKEVLINDQKRINVILELDTAALDEVVVIGYGTQRKESVTGSVASIKGEEMRDVPSANITQSLQGRVSGVEFAQSSTKPGASMQIRVRGTRSLNASNDPLIVLDGIPFAGSITDLNPTDIKSVDILKDASSTAIYGSRGANGVILVTTNKGSKGQEAKISYTSYFGVKNIFAKYPMMNGEQFVKLRTEANIYQNPGLDESNDVNTDWQDLLFGTATVTSHDIGISGGGEKSNYNFGLGYYKDESVLPGQDYERISLRASIDQEIGEYIKVGFTTNNNYSVSNGNSLGIYGTLNSSPISDPYNDDGSLKRVIQMPADPQWVYTRNSIEALGDRYIDQTRSLGSYNSVYGVVQIPGIEGLSYRINLGLNYRQSNSGYYQGEGVFSDNPTTVSSAAISNSHTTSWTIENILSYDRTFADKHNFNVLALYSSEENSYNKSRITAKDIPTDSFQFYNLGRANEQPVVDPKEQLYSVSGLQSVMGRLMYSYDNRYMLSASYRTDGSSRLAPGHKWVSYPAVSVGWNIHNESFMEDVSLINSLKLRAGYGTTSNQSIDPYSTLGQLGTTPYNYGDTYTTGFSISELPNPDLGWEKSTTMNYGLDFSILNNRLSGTVDYYNTKTTDLLFRVALPQTSGVGSYMANIGESENKGLEFALNAVILDNPDGLTWDVGINVYTNKNELTKLASGLDRDESNWWFVGHPIDVIYDYKAVGLWNQDDPQYQYLKTFEPGGAAGMIKAEYTGDYNPDGSPVRAIGPDDRQIMSMQADFQGGFNTRLTYKSIDLSIVGTFKSGGLLIATPYGSNGYLNILTGRRGNIDVDYWTPDNTDAKFPKPGGIGGDQPRYLNSLSYIDASYMKIRTITLGYNFEQSEWFKNTGIDKLRLYVTAQNPFVFFSPYKKLSGMDPETNSFANENSAVTIGADDQRKRLLTIGTNTPTTTNYVVGLNISF
ncbi:TonB-dependent receptor [Mariniflexile litorale]|uniref:TonB-dependent receptor n=1 Tax=Mariniflexile litorale TaxID=3045158 RepID=A0AAU7EEY4_9FLAO|nr:TonB-dependent receptor [Mariniflexile sp. KMM 9835]MDQ8210835.1 TonB-dependent receptor [Mariniflexile sp. KMM 9835]